MTRFLVNKWIHILVLFAILLAGVYVRTQDYNWIKSLRYIAFDALNKQYPRQATGEAVVIDIDEASMDKAELGQWPWPRTIVAQLVDNLKKAGASTIVFDVVFAEEDRTSPHKFLERLPEDNKAPALTSLLQGMQSNDEVLAASIKKAGNVVMGFTAANRIEDHTLPRRKVNILAKRDAKQALQENARFISSYTSNIAALTKPAAGHGSFIASPEVDGILRRVNLLFRGQNPKNGKMVLLPSLSLEAVRVAQNPKIPLKVRLLDGNEAGALNPPMQMKLGQYEIPADKDTSFYVYFSKKREDMYLSAWKVALDNFDYSLVKGKIAIIGSSAEGLRDIRSTPLDLFVSGIEVHVNVIEQILSGDFLLRPNLMQGLELISVIVIGSLIIVLAPFIGAVMMAVFTLLIIGGMAYASWYAYLHMGLLLDPVYPAIALGVLYIMSSLLSYVRAEMERKQVRDAFGHYISPDFMEELEKNPDSLKLGGEVRELSVMFTDVRSFTTISESLTPEELIQLMNDFLTPMSSLVMENRGTIDKYMGDAMMAFWNAPLDDSNHARNACIAALGMTDALEPVNEGLRKRAEKGGKEPLVINAGIGINTGPCSVGNMGSEQRFAYSALGDAVNLASRLEGQTKSYGVQILIGEETRNQAPDLAVLELDLIRVKGKTEPVRIFTLLGHEDMAESDDFKQWQSKHDAMLTAYRAAQFKDAIDLMNTCRGLDKHAMLSGYYDLYEARAKEYLDTPPPANWDGVFIATSK